jgi:hypothetical protein
MSLGTLGTNSIKVELVHRRFDKAWSHHDLTEPFEDSKILSKVSIVERPLQSLSTWP